MTRRISTRTVTAAVRVPLMLAPVDCTTLPSNSNPQAVSSYAPVPEVEDLPGPDDGQAPDLMLRDFYVAATHPGNNRQAAKEFLTSEAQDSWLDGDSTKILDRIDINATSAVGGDTLTYVVRGTIVGRWDRWSLPAGQYPVPGGDRAVRHGDGGASTLPDGVVLTVRTSSPPTRRATSTSWIPTGISWSRTDVGSTANRRTSASP